MQNVLGKHDNLETWFRGYGMRLIQEVVDSYPVQRILDGHFHIYYKNCNVCLKRPKINVKRGRGWPIFLKKHDNMESIVVRCQAKHFQKGINLVSTNLDDR